MLSEQLECSGYLINIHHWIMYIDTKGDYVENKYFLYKNVFLIIKLQVYHRIYFLSTTCKMWHKADV